MIDFPTPTFGGVNSSRFFSFFRIARAGCFLLIISVATAAMTAAQAPVNEALLKQWKAAADAGDAKVQNYLGYIYANGEGVEKNPYESIRWYRPAAESGVADAQAYLGFAYYRGVGVLARPEEAVKWWTKSADQGNASAQENLAFMYFTGKGVEKNVAEAARCGGAGGCAPNAPTSNRRSNRAPA